jgi:hypothetical protein
MLPGHHRSHPRGCRRPAARRGSLALLLAVAGLFMLCPGRIQAESAVSKEYQVKAAFLFNFCRFVEWPSSTFSGPAAPIVIGVLGNDPFGSALDDIVHDETVRGRTLVVRHDLKEEDIQQCHLLYIAKSAKERLTDILAAAAPQAVLIVSDIDQFAHRGGMIGFYLEGKKIRFEINAALAQQHTLKLNAQLLSLGKIVTADGDKGRE